MTGHRSLLCVVGGDTDVNELEYLTRHIYMVRNLGIFGKNPHIFVLPKL